MDCQEDGRHGGDRDVHPEITRVEEADAGPGAEPDLLEQVVEDECRCRPDCRAERPIARDEREVEDEVDEDGAKIHAHHVPDLPEDHQRGSVEAERGLHVIPA